MKVSELNDFKTLMILQEEIKKRLSDIEKKIKIMNAKCNAAQDAGRKTAVEQCLAQLKRHREAEKNLLLECEKTTAQIGAELAEKSYLLSPFEEVIVYKRFVEGKTMYEVQSELQSTPGYEDFSRERTSCYRAQKRALDKLQGGGRLSPKWATEHDDRVDKENKTADVLRRKYHYPVDDTKATNKEKPKPVLICATKGKTYVDYICPTCGWIISQQRADGMNGTNSELYKPKYHDECGQHLDWSKPQPWEAKQ